MQPAKHHQRSFGGRRQHEVSVRAGGQRRLRGRLRAEERLRENHLQGRWKLGGNSTKGVSDLQRYKNNKIQKLVHYLKLIENAYTFILQTSLLFCVHSKFCCYTAKLSA